MTEPEQTPTPDSPPVEEAKPSGSKALLAAAKLPERLVDLCLRADMQAEYEDLERQLGEASTSKVLDPRLNSGGEERRIAQQIEAMQHEMREFTLTLRLRAVNRRRWDELNKEHPPRTEGPEAEEDKVLGYNSDTFFDAAIRECTVEPTDLDDADWAALLNEKTTAHQYRRLVDAVLALNVRKVDVPNSRAASRILRASEPA